jgi:hypothetical protein
MDHVHRGARAYRADCDPFRANFVGTKLKLRHYPDSVQRVDRMDESRCQEHGFWTETLPARLPFVHDSDQMLEREEIIDDARFHRGRVVPQFEFSFKAKSNDRQQAPVRTGQNSNSPED